MRQVRLLTALVVTLAAPSLAATHYRYVHDERADVYFGHVSYCDPDDGGPEGPKLLRGERAEAAQLNLPLTPGDRILTAPSRRCEVQFDTGTLVRVDTDSNLLIETVLATSLSSGKSLTNLVLESGRVRLMYRDYDASEVFQVLTANAAIRLERAAVVEIATGDTGTSLRVEKGRAALLYGAGPGHTKTRKLKAGEGVTVTSSHALVAGAGPAPAAFAAWNRDLDRRFDELHRGRSKLPKKVYKYPPAVVQFAERWSSAYGEWIWTDFYGYAWRPYLSSDEGWRPFLLGQWTSIDGRRYWVPQEPWGWVPYHLGLWHWDARDGWVWIPGSTFAPAWTVWTVCANDVIWRPIGFWDWGVWQDPSRPPGYSLLSGGAPYAFVGPTARCAVPRFGGPPAESARDFTPAFAKVPAAQPTPGPEPEPDEDERPRPPREIRKLVDRFERRVAQGDPEALESVERVSAAVGILVGSHRPEPPADESPRRDSDAFVAAAPQREPGIAADAARPPVLLPTPAASDLRGEPEPQRPLEARFRDWNPDVRAARDVGGRIRYDSERNAVACDGCRRPLSRPAWLEPSSGRSGSGSSAGDASGGSGAAASSTPGGGAAASGARAGAGPAEKREHD